MSDSYLSLVKNPVRESHTYMLPQIDYVVKANQNENPWDVPREIKQEILSAIGSRSWNRYPALTAPNIRMKIAESHTVRYEQIAVGNGSNEIMLAIMQTLLADDRTMVTVEPTFSLYAHYAKILGADVKSLPLGEDFRFPVDSLVKNSAQKEVSLTVICSPNNPTGNTITQADLVKILQSANGYVLVDEAYVDFTDQQFIPLFAQYENLIITRTFSKAFAFGLGRFGYIIGATNFISEIYKVLLPYNLNGFSEIAAGILLKNREKLIYQIDEIKNQRAFLSTELKKIDGLTVYPSEANFLLVKFKNSAEQVFNAMLNEKILLRNVSNYPGLGNHLRISIGTHQENQKIVENLNKYCG